MDYSALLEKFANATATEEEARDFNDWLKTLPAEEYKQVLDEYEGILMKKEIKEEHRQEWLEELLNKIKEPGGLSERHQGDAPVVPMHRGRRRGWWIAAAAIIVMIVGGWWVIERQKSDAGGQKLEVAKSNDVEAPKETRAVITLADGTKLYLDSSGSGVLAQENSVTVVKNENGEIEYRSQQSEVGGPIAYNIAFNPRGSSVLPLTLNDGTKVWLNSESSLKYPAAFTGNTREVEITGEAYFEVAHDASKPFHVRKGATDIAVLGTHFNVNAYDDEDGLRVTLLEGSVKVSASNKSITIRPGEQAKTVSGELSLVSGVDTDEVMAWKNGLFSFNKVDIKTVMRQLARWYDLEVVYEGTVTNDRFWGDMQRDLPLSKTLDFLKKSQVHFRVEGKKVTVMP